MEIRDLVRTWFQKWETGDYEHIPVTDDFSHTSPFGTISGKKTYLDLVEANKDKFLEHRFQIRDEIYHTDRACVRYLAIHGNDSYEVSEWYYTQGGLIQKIVANFNTGKIPEDRTLKDPE